MSYEDWHIIEQGALHGYQTIEFVHHVTHLDNAIEIIKNGKINSSLVYDESILNQERIQVVWLSPNHWNKGYRYGNVRFTFRFTDLLPQIYNNQYWIEKMDNYSPTAHRFLLTDNDYSRTLESYCMFHDSGALQISPEINYTWDNNICLELMLEGDLSLEKCVQIDLVYHHPDLCNKDKRGEKCHEGPLDHPDVGAKFLASIIGKKLNSDTPYFVRNDPNTITLEESKARLIRNLGSATSEYSGSINGNSTTGRSLARAICSSYYERPLDVKNLVGLFSSNEDLEKAISKEVDIEFL